MNSYESVSREVLEIWLRMIEKSIGTPIDTTFYVRLLTFDNIGRVGLSKDFGVLEAGVPDRMLEMLEATFSLLASCGLVYWPLGIFMQLPQFGLQKEFTALSERMTTQRLAVSSKSESLPLPLLYTNIRCYGKVPSVNKSDIMETFIKDYHSQKPCAFVDHKTLVSDCQVLLIGAT